MSKATGQDVGTEPKVEAFFKDENDDPVLRKHLRFTTTLGEVRKANPFGPSECWVELHLPSAGRLEQVELLSTRDRRGAWLSYTMNIDDIIALCDDEESDRVATSVGAVIWEWGERIKTALGAESFAVNWGGPDAKYVQADGSVTYYLDGRFGYVLFERNYKFRKELDAVTLNELSSRASVLCDLLESVLAEIRGFRSGTEFSHQ